MKVLSIKQPWSSLIIEGIKDIENRTWKTDYRGKILVHTSGSPAFYSLRQGLSIERRDEIAKHNIKAYPKDLILSGSNTWLYSAIIGEVEIVDCVRNHPSIWADQWELKNRKQKDGSTVPVEVPVWNWVLANPVKYKNPILNVKGNLSLWEFENDLISA